MTSIALKLEDDEAKKLAEIAAREGTTPEDLVRRAVRASLATDAERAEMIRRGFAQIEAGDCLTLEEFEEEMDRFMESLEADHA